MNIEYLVKLLENKSIVLNDAKVVAFSVGDLERINALEVEINEVQNTLYKLRLLQTTEQAAAVANMSVQTMMAAGVEAIQNTPILLDDATACLALYDISTYAADPLHEQKIADILGLMSAMDTAAQIDAYINTEAIASPLNGQMILSAAQKYNVDCRLIMAMMELDSRFGTAGVAVNTFNPGNVGNTGSATRTYASWQEGVEAVAEWLNRHRRAAGAAAIITPPAENPVAETPPIQELAQTPEPIVEAPSAETVPAETPPAEIPPVEIPVVNSDVSTTTPEAPIASPEAAVPPIDVGAATTTPAISEAPIVNPDISTTTPVVGAPIPSETPAADSIATSSAEAGR